MGDDHLKLLGLWRDMLALGLTSWAESPELLSNLTKSCVFAVLRTASRMNWSQLELTNTNCRKQETLATARQSAIWLIR